MDNKKVFKEIEDGGSLSAINEFRSAVNAYNLRWPSQLNEFEKH